MTQLVLLLMVVVLVMLAPVLLLVSTTLTALAPEVQVPAMVAALSSLRLISLLPAMSLMVGAGKVLMLTRGVVPARPLLLEASLYRPAATVMLETAEAVLAAGVKVAL